MINTIKRTISVGIDNAQSFGGEILKVDSILIGGLIILGAVFIQIFFPPGTRTISRRTWIENFHNLPRIWSILGSISISPKYLKVYRCPSCHKLLAKGHLMHKDDILEVKCRGCSTICLFKGEDADILEKRSELLKEGLIPDPDLQK